MTVTLTLHADTKRALAGIGVLVAVLRGLERVAPELVDFVQSRRFLDLKRLPAERANEVRLSVELRDELFTLLLASGASDGNCEAVRAAFGHEDRLLATAALGDERGPM